MTGSISPPLPPQSAKAKLFRTFTLCALLLLVLALVVSIKSVKFTATTREDRAATPAATATVATTASRRPLTEAPASAAALNMTLFSDKCMGADHRSYVTPVGNCYSPKIMFPGDPSWSDFDVLDVVLSDMSEPTIQRTIFRSTNGSCKSDSEGRGDDVFAIPIGVCVGPFGMPRPWGKFDLLEPFGDREETTEGSVSRLASQ